jgi:hypothetical protein
MIRHWPAAFEGRDGGPAQCSRRLQQIYQALFPSSSNGRYPCFHPWGNSSSRPSGYYYRNLGSLFRPFWSYKRKTIQRQKKAGRLIEKLVL